MVTFIEKTLLFATLGILFRTTTGKCEMGIPRGFINSSCTHEIGETCAFNCALGFKQTSGVNRVVCQENGVWEPSEPCEENDHGLVVTLTQKFKSTSKSILTVPTAPDGTTNFDYIRRISLPSDFQFLSVGGDVVLRQVYMYDYYTNSIYMASNFSIGISANNKWTSYHKGLSKAFVKLSVDWISHNIYWTDPQYKWIAVQSLLSNNSSMYRVLIHENLEGPHGLALDPMEALIFWSDIGNITKIEVSSLSGRKRKSLIYTNLLKPYSLAADYRTKHLYFLDAYREVVETTTYEGRDRKILLRKTNSIFFDMAVFKDYLYVTNSNNDLLYFFNKTSGEELQKSLYIPGDTYYGVTVFHPDAQPTSATANCVNYDCEHICVTEKDGATCLCKEGYRLNQDMKTCLLNNEYFHRGLVFSNDSSICIVDIRIITHFSYDPKCVLETDGTKYMIVDTDERQIIIANETAIYRASVDNPELHRLTVQSGMISGLAWDGYDRNVYWTEIDTGIIWRLSRESNNAQVVLEGLNKPRDIMILPHERLMYWISDRNGSTIESSNVDGTNHQVVLDSKVLKNPKSLSFDQDKMRIYFLDTILEGLSNVYSCQPDGAGLFQFISVHENLEKLEIYKGLLLLTSKDDANRTILTSYSVDRITTTASGVFPGTGNISAIKVFDENFRQNETGPCYNMNGDCEQICLSNGKSRICECVFGFKLGLNGMTCTSDPITDNFMLISASTHNKIYQVSMMDESVQGINAKAKRIMKGATYIPLHNLVIWGAWESEISIIQLNGTGKKIFPLAIIDDTYQYLSQFAVDYSTGNIYYTAAKSVSSYSSFKSYIGVLLPNGIESVIVSNLGFPYGLVVYPSKGLLFYADNGPKPHIGRANMDGSQQSVILGIDKSWPSELTIDYKNDYLYWIDTWSNGIQYCKLDGTDYRKLVAFPGVSVTGLAVYQDYLFISTEHSIRKVKISNPNETTEFAAYDEIGMIQSISIYSSTFQIKNAFCSKGNGGCSTFCFPTPGGGICGCENGVDFINGSDKFCSNIPRCPEILNQIIVSADCLRVNGSKCTFTCKEGYQVKHGANQVLCNSANYIPSDACEEIKCPASLANGKWVNCSFSVNKVCQYTCDYSYTRNDAVTEVECQINGSWKSVNTDNLCQGKTCEINAHQCPKEIPNGAFHNESKGQICSTAIVILSVTVGFSNKKVPLAVSSAQHNEAHSAVIGVGVTIGIIIVIVIILVILRRRRLNSSFAPKRMKEEVMSTLDMLTNTSFVPEADIRATYENGAVDITGLIKTDGPIEASVSFENTCRENSLKYDSTMAIPRPHAKLNV